MIFSKILRFGHQDKITGIDAGIRERAISAGGRDGSVRVWKIVEESQLIFNGPSSSIDAVKLINEENFVSCGEDG
jgi:ribosomal RNA-processing protein 9